MQHHFMRDTTGVKKLFLKLWSGAHYCRVAQIYWVARHKQRKKQIHGLTKSIHMQVKHLSIYLISDSAVAWKRCLEFSDV